jgi:hypothetical protein
MRSTGAVIAPGFVQARSLFRVLAISMGGPLYEPLDVRADLLSELHARVVVPLIRLEAFGRKASRMHPRFTVTGQDLVMASHLIAAVRRPTLGRPLAPLWSGV